MGLSRLAPNIPMNILPVQLPILFVLIYNYWVLCVYATTIASAVIRGVLFVIGIEATDLFSGLLHIYFDHEQTTHSWFYPIRQVAHAFQSHHAKPNIVADENVFWSITDTVVMQLIYMPAMYILHQYQLWDGMAYLVEMMTCGMLVQASHANCHRTSTTRHTRVTSRLRPGTPTGS